MCVSRKVVHDRLSVETTEDDDEKVLAYELHGAFSGVAIRMTSYVTVTVTVFDFPRSPTRISSEKQQQILLSTDNN